jgi:hypothetical protein
MHRATSVHKYNLRQERRGYWFSGHAMPEMNHHKHLQALSKINVGCIHAPNIPHRQLKSLKP